MMKHLMTSFVMLMALVGVQGCGGEDPGNGTTAVDVGTGPLLPWKQGNKWTYKVTDPTTNGVTDKTTEVGAEENVGGSGPHSGEKANKVTTTKDGTSGSADKTESWQALSGDKVIRYRELSYHATTGALELEEYWDPCKIHIDWSADRSQKGASWLEDYQETKIKQSTGTPTTATQRDRWTVTEFGVSITVPAGTFNAIHLTKIGAATTKEYWYVRGVGKVKEAGGQTEELVSYALQP